MPCRVKSSGGNRVPSLTGEDSGVQFLLPEDFKWLTLRVIVNARKSDESGVGWAERGIGLLDQVEPLPYANDLTCLRHSFRANHVSAIPQENPSLQFVNSTGRTS